MTEQDKPTLVPAVLNDLVDVDGEPTAGDTLVFDGTAWAPGKGSGGVPCVFYQNGPVTPVARVIPMLDGQSDSGMPAQGTDVVVDGDSLLVEVTANYTVTYSFTADYNVTGHANFNLLDSRVYWTVDDHQDDYPPTNYFYDQDVRMFVTGDGITLARVLHGGSWTYLLSAGNRLTPKVFDASDTNRNPTVRVASVVIVRT